MLRLILDVKCGLIDIASHENIQLQLNLTLSLIQSTKVGYMCSRRQDGLRPRNM